ncbi:cadherin-like domain-containing protein [Pseudomonas stutzeri]|nr:cadherin-like domain-containing protein [Stutzerimonas stutzeri]
MDGDSLSIASVTSGTGGTAVLNADGTVTFTPDADFNGVAPQTCWATTATWTATA